MTYKYCPNCQKNVDTEHSWNVVLLVVLLIFLLIPGLIYLALTYDKRRCPICHTAEPMLENARQLPQQPTSAEIAPKQ